ncbi:Glycosyltransferase family 92 protein [Caenorhabditis elegans]|uniref:Glycosyltransferase family 92 protein n=1 Tax=Caenorhabditis elegans TaxID=6239 RepID=O17018_CAEEL|nr:Glycosyltransferase family 92 protein [Caenorhabditis elegans]CCD71525.2 Glycosyltransferase family 92 protein [Caenorhabditis elegans]|eukprot:NP_503256.2 Uncharacterized protein CELE_ZK488.6 [Caenorhabditis elegans]
MEREALLHTSSSPKNSELSSPTKRPSKSLLIIFALTNVAFLICFSKIKFSTGGTEVTKIARPEVIVKVPTEISTTSTALSSTSQFISSTNAPAPRSPENKIFPQNSTDCPYEQWNQVRTDFIPNMNFHKKLSKKWKSDFKYLYHTLPSAGAAFVHEDQIVVTLTAENQVDDTVYCRYYDCRRREIMDPFKSTIFPRCTVFCPRRPGTKFITISKDLNETLEYSIPIVPRLEKPPHYFTVCMATLYGDEPKFLQIVDFIEYHKLQGATFFHIYLRNVSDYDRVLLDNYVKTGDIELITLQDHFWRADYMWHHGQINDCHHRSKHFSKWTALIDIDERLEMKSDKFKTVVDYLDSIQDDSISSLRFRVKWVMKHNYTPARYENETQLQSEMIFHKYQNTSQLGRERDQPKCIIRPENVAMMSIHGPKDMYKGKKKIVVPEDTGFIRHYRNVENKIFAHGYKKMMSHAPFNISPIDHDIDKDLSKKIMDRVKWTYEIVQPTCEQKAKMYRVESTSPPCNNETKNLN